MAEQARRSHVGATNETLSGGSRRIILYVMRETYSRIVLFLLSDGLDGSSVQRAYQTVAAPAGLNIRAPILGYRMRLLEALTGTENISNRVGSASSAAST
ncbi:hypothetical protein [Caballeronia sp.]|uniref:hypothetical protein n=1 Tax=Caballeronia sp. TaxID=1931223 RepID=UPI003C60ACBF